MSAASAASSEPFAGARAVAARGGLAHAYRVERRKLLAQLSTRGIALVCALGPFAFAAVLHLQSGVPGDTLLGVWVHSSGYAVDFVVLGFGGFWGFPVLAGALAGDLFACEDRYGTWKTLLTRSVSRREVFLGKVLAVATLALGLLALLAVSALLAGFLFTGGQPLVGLGGRTIPGGEAFVLVLASWLLCTLPVLAFTSLAVLFSIVSRNGIVGVLGPILVGLLMQLLALVGSASWVHLLLVASAFDDWHGLLTAHAFYGALVVGSLVSVLWIAACLAISWRILRQRDFAGTPVAKRAGWILPVRVVLGSAAVIVLLGVATSWGPTTITKGRLQASLAPAFNELTALQQRELGRPVPNGDRLDDRTTCHRRTGAGEGPGEWSCTVAVVTPTPGELQSVTYDVSVQSNGCYKAEAPPSFIGNQTMVDVHGDTVVNPLYTIYGCFDVTAASKGCGETTSCSASNSRASATPAAGSAAARGASRRSRTETEALRVSERTAGPKVMHEIEEAERREARHGEPAPEQPVTPAFERGRR